MGTARQGRTIRVACASRRRDVGMALYGIQILSNVCAQQANNPMVPHVSDAQEGRVGWQESDADV